jgi:hypothetical protein
MTNPWQLADRIDETKGLVIGNRSPFFEAKLQVGVAVFPLYRPIGVSTKLG